MTDTEIAELIAQKTAELGGNVYFVGGYVRDRILNRENKDIDIEIHGITPTQLEQILDSVGECIKIGKSFGIYGLKGYSIENTDLPDKPDYRGIKDFVMSVNERIVIGADK